MVGDVHVEVVGDEGIADALGRLLADVCAAEGAPGATAAARVGNRSGAVAAGVSDPRSGSPMRLSAELRLSSMVKPFTAIAVLAESDAGRIDLDGQVAEQLRGIEVPPGPTVRDLLVHTGGIRRPGFFHVMPGEQRPSVVEHYGSVGVEIGYAPGTAFEYSNDGYALLGELVAERLGTSYTSGVKQAILDPIGATIDFDESVDHDPGYALVVGSDDDAGLVDIRDLGRFPFGDFDDDAVVVDGQLVKMPSYIPVLDAASGGWSTVEELVKLPAAIIDGALPLAEETAATLTTNQTRAGFKPRAFGFLLDELDGDLVAWHSGGWPGYSGTVGFCVSRKIAFAAMFNMSVEARGDLGLTIVDALTH
jgi:CubicO group peptidase (beta-lactamase class C family)